MGNYPLVIVVKRDVMFDFDLGRANGPQSTDQQWVDTWNFALEDVYGSRPSFCQSTSFDSLKYDNSYYY